ncbi:splicing regulatory glutamine/lysine-rich protein 1-like, partial [Rhopilema esculentum]|uniref:splicing regulatory glutamine/lysine-rich protein 1-like n=1 Tax=Rhopilema esculentum TaxID=499914 RepID=UPI0031CE0571
MQKHPGVLSNKTLMKQATHTNNNREEGNTNKDGDRKSFAQRIQQTRFHGTETARRTLRIETDERPIKGADNPRLLRRRQKELRSKDPTNQVSWNRDGKKDFENRDGRAADHRSGQPSSIETETERASLKGSSKPGSRKQRRQEGLSWIETDVLPIKGAGKPRLLRRRQKELRSKDPANQVSRNRDGKKDFVDRDGRAVDQRGGQPSSIETETERASLKGSNKPGFMEQRRIQKTRFQGTETARRTLRIETDERPIKGAGNPRLLRRRQKELLSKDPANQVSRNRDGKKDFVDRDGRAVDQRSGQPSSIETETERASLKGSNKPGFKEQRR